MSKSETVTASIVIYPEMIDRVTTKNGGEVEKIPVFGKVKVGDHVYTLNIWNGAVTLDRWTKSGKRESKAPKTDI